MATQMIARKAHNNRNGHYYSLRVVNEATGNSIEFARLRMESGGWNVWAADMDEQRTIMHHVCQAGRNAPLAVALAAVRKGYNDWHGIEDVDAAYEAWVASMGDATGPGQDWDCNH
jgi:hypothetical protein